MGGTVLAMAASSVAGGQVALLVVEVAAAGLLLFVALSLSSGLVVL